MTIIGYGDGEPIRKMTAGSFEVSHLEQLYNCMDAVIKDGFYDQSNGGKKVRSVPKLSIATTSSPRSRARMALSRQVRIVS